MPPKPGEPAAVAARRVAEGTLPSTWETQISGLDSLWTSTSDEIATGRASYGDLPLVALTAGRAYTGAPTAVRSRLSRFWCELHAEIAIPSRLGLERTINGSSHLMPFDQPDAIAAAVDEIAAQTRSEKNVG
jgi:hypothetical protein